MAGWLLFLQSSPVGLTGDVGDLARSHEWGVMIGSLVFCGFVTAVLLFGAFKFCGSIIRLYKDAIDANGRLSESIDKMADATQESHKELQHFLTKGFETLGKDLNKIGEIVEDHEGRIGGLETTVYNTDKKGEENG